MNQPLPSVLSFWKAHRTLGKALAIAVLGSLALPESAAAQTPAFKLWSLKRTEQDSALVRSANVTASAATASKLVLSNGTNVPAYIPYSARYGQAFAPTADGEWGSGAGGPGTSLNREFYKQFTVTAAAGATARVDSLLLWSAVYNSSAGRMAVSYSRDGFVADINEVTGGKGPGGLLASTANGAFTTFITLNNQNAGTNQNYRLALAGATGVTLTAGQTLTIRVYYSVGTSSAGRYALLKDVTVKSTQAVLSNKVARAAQALTAYPNPTQHTLTVAHPAATKDSRVAVYDANGRTAASFVPTPSTTTSNLHLDSLTQGIYLVEYFDGQQRITSKVVKL